jgi:indolepyruvate decarboxylase
VALLGAMLASPERRHILLTGEGSMQMTVQELSTVLRHGLAPWVFVVQNEGYTVERAVLGKDAKYNDVARWRYAELPSVFGHGGQAETFVVTTSAQLQAVLDAPHAGMVLVECAMDRYDAPIDLIVGGHAIANTDYGARGPQTVANAQL